MPAEVTLSIQRATWNGITWEAAAGRALRLEYRQGGEPRADHAPGCQYPTFVAAAPGLCIARLSVPEFKPNVAPGAKSDLVATLKTRAGQQTVTLRNMVLTGLAAQQDPAGAAVCVLVFAHESADGVSNPIA